MLLLKNINVQMMINIKSGKDFIEKLITKINMGKGGVGNGFFSAIKKSNGRRNRSTKALCSYVGTCPR